MDDWEDETTVSTSSAVNIGVVAEGGRKFSSGRGFKAVQDNDENAWGASNTGNASSSFFVVFFFFGK